MKTSSILISASLATALLSSCGGGEHDHALATEHAAMMKADSTAKADRAAQEAIVKSMFDALNTGKTDGLDDVLAEDFVEHQQDPAVTSTGRQAVKDMFALIHTAYPDFKQEIVAMNIANDLAFVHFRMRGTNTGPWGAMPATGKTMDVMGTDVIRFANGKAAEHWGYMEEMKLMTQLGMMPEPGAEPAKK